MHYVSKGEAICDLALPVDTLSGIRSCLFEECRENGLTHPNNVIKLKGLAINSLGHLAPSRLFTEPEGCPTNHDQEQEERLSCPKLMEEQMQNWGQCFKISCCLILMQEASIIDDHDCQPYYCYLPNPSSFTSNIISRDLCAEVTTLKSQPSLLERHSDWGIIKNELQQMKFMLVDLSLKVSSPPHTTETSIYSWCSNYPS